MDGAQLIQQGHVAAAVAYLAATLLGALLATWIGIGFVRHLTGAQR
ncbi:MAG: hypothetical protein ACRDRH_17260 [Pseudonocardia sp.]